MLSLRAAQIIARVDRSREPEASGKFGCEIRENIRVEIRRADHVELRRISNQHRGGRVDDHLVQFHIRKVFRHLPYLTEKETV